MITQMVAGVVVLFLVIVAVIDADNGRLELAAVVLLGAIVVELAAMLAMIERKR